MERMAVHAHDGGRPEMRGGARQVGRLRAVFVLTALFVIVEAVVAVVADSLALLGDAAHMLVDAVAIGLSVAAIGLASRPPRDGQRTFGLYRLEVLAALANALLLLAAAIYLLVEAGLRLADGSEPDAIPMLAAACAAFAVNLICYLLLRPGSESSLNVSAALVDVMADLVGSAGVIVAAIVIEVSGWTEADPIVGAAIGCWILPRAWRLAGQSLRVLLQAAPEHLDVVGLRRALGALPGVLDVHDLHVWTLTSEMDVASAHLVVAAGADPHPVLDSARALLRNDYDIAHATLQVEPDDHEGCAEISW